MTRTKELRPPPPGEDGEVHLPQLSPATGGINVPRTIRNRLEHEEPVTLSGEEKEAQKALRASHDHAAPLLADPVDRKAHEQEVELKHAVHQRYDLGHMPPAPGTESSKHNIKSNDRTSHANFPHFKGRTEDHRVTGKPS